MPIFDSLDVNKDSELSSDMDLSDEDVRGRHRIGSPIEHDTCDERYRVTWELRRKELASDPRIEQLGPAARLYRLYLEHPDAEHWTDVQTAQEFGVTVKTIFNYRRTILRFRNELRESIVG